MPLNVIILQSKMLLKELKSYFISESWLKIQKTPFNVINLGQNITDNINLKISISEYVTHISCCELFGTWPTWSV
jgi:hypothetical protein